MSARVPESKLKKAIERQNQPKKIKVASCTPAYRHKKGMEVHQKWMKQKKETIAMRRKADKEGSFFVEAAPKVAFVMRTKGIHKVPPRPRKILCLLRLRQIYNGVFVKLNSSTIPMLRHIEPWVTYGQLSTPTVKNLLFKRGFVKLNTQRIQMQNNQIIEAAFAKTKEVNCFDDIVDQITNCGPQFKRVTSTLWPFKLLPPRGGINKKRKHFIEGGDYGNREAYMNQFVKQCL
ncbi:60S ribosomal protein L7 [Perkinsela sp. CCAP 1560/4]|nr:60S ribosomal protein L7 [Perkinsela sp. CCAP 1560/4]|eukprot:KNH01783.1 60S ribosomal protein L7 [Perkinsela sp. CCAP 1560/4]